MDIGVYSRDKTVGPVTAFVILLMLCAWGFWPEIKITISGALRSSEVSHAMAVPLGILLLIFLRRQELKSSLTNGSAWGVVILVVGIATHALAIWPFNYGYARDLSIILVLAGVVLVSCGWRVLKLSFPMLLLVALAVPIGMRLYANLVIKPETYTIRLTAGLLDMLPGLNIIVRGTDIIVRGTDTAFQTAHNYGVVALGESNRGAQLMSAFAVIAVFVLFSRPRRLWQIIAGLIITPVVMLFVNFIRFLSWALVSIIFGCDPLSSLPRLASAIISLVIAYGLFALLFAIDLSFLIKPAEQNSPDS